MKKPKHLYIFLSPVFGFPIVKYFCENDLSERINIHLIFSSAAYYPKRKPFNPFILLDYINQFKNKQKIRGQLKPLDLNIDFTRVVNQDQTIKNIPENSLGLCLGFNQIFNQNTIDKFSNFVNLHPSLLPYYKGPTPLEWCLKNGEETTGWTLHQVDEKIDSGEIIYQSIIPIKNKSLAILQSEIAESAKIILLEYIKHQIDSTNFEHKILDAKQYYKHPTGYQSFIK